MIQLKGPDMATSLKARMDALEAEVAHLKARIPPSAAGHDWVDKIGGKFTTPADKAAFDEAMRYGREWRESFRVRARKNGKPSR